MHPDDIAVQLNAADHAAAVATTRLEPMLIRLPPQLATELRNLARRTRVRQSDYLREAVADLLAKYGQHPEQQRAM
ncbi:MAG: ribbon-helix-helix domain-containing protein [Anaeromyxobacter sp.]